MKRQKIQPIRPSRIRTCLDIPDSQTDFGKTIPMKIACRTERKFSVKLLTKIKKSFHSNIYVVKIADI